MLRFARIRSLVLFALAGAAGFAAEGVSLRGVIAMDKELSFCLMNQDSGVSAWVKVGGAFGEFAVKRYSAETGTLTLEKGGKETQLVLHDAPILAAPGTAAVSSFEELKLALGSGKTFEESVAIGQAHGRVLLPVNEGKDVKVYMLAPPGTVVDATKPISGGKVIMFMPKGEELRRVLFIR